MSIERKLIGTTDAATSSAVYVEDVFSTWLYNGTGASQTITNGIDLATKGGMVWTKNRGRGGDTTLSSNNIWDTIRGAGFALRTNASGIQGDWGTANFASFNLNGFTLGPNAIANVSGDTYASWTFAKQAKFFDVVAYTGNGSSQTIAHNLGATPGMILIKSVSSAANWVVYHRSLGSGTNGRLNLVLNSTGTASDDGHFPSAPTSSAFTVGPYAPTSSNGATYVAYLFADSNSGGFGASGTDSVVACGSLSGSSSTDVTLGWEPQYILFKNATDGGSWYVADIMRGASNTRSYLLQTNTSDAELDLGAAGTIPTATGFTFKGANFGYTSGQNIIYLAIRRGPMRTPTDATKVFAPEIWTGDGTNTKDITSGFPIDLFISKGRDAVISGLFRARLIGGNKFLYPNATDAEGSNYAVDFASNTQVLNLPSSYDSFNGTTFAGWMFRRAPGFFDVVCWTGNNSIISISHNLGVTPELIISKSRSLTTAYEVYAAPLGATKYIRLNSTGAAGTYNLYSALSNTSFSFDTSASYFDSGTSVSYLFASCPGVSKVGSYTGNGSSQTIDCGFASGARFVLIKRTDSTGDWYVWDTARGIVSGNDPRLSLNTTDAEVTTDDSIDPASSGFIVNQLSATNINVSSATYIYLSIA